LKYFSLFLLAAGIGVAGQAQNEKIQTDRPNETQNAETIEKGFFQAELGFRKEKEDENQYKYLHPVALLKYGLTKRFELRAEVKETTQKFMNEKATGLLPLELGFKLNLVEGKGALPTTSLLTQVGFPDLASEAFKAEHLFPRVRLLFQNKLSDKIELGYNVGAEWDGETSTPQWVYTFSPQLELGEKAFVFAEAYGFLRKGEHPEHYADAGLGLFLSRNVVWDLSGGVKLSPHGSPYFLETGISFRLKP
jgi:hypothetical protein